jgi:FAD-linked oxidoreductase
MKRRKLLKNTGIVLGGAAITGVVGTKVLTSKISDPIDSSQVADGEKVWSNWSGSQKCQPTQFFLPKSEAELAKKLKESTEVLRVVGGGHSFSPVVPTNQVLTSLKNISGIIHHDKTTNIATIGAGSHLYNLTPEMHQQGLAFVNQGDVDKQSLGGAVSTSTHGTGKALTSFAGMVKGFRLVTADGQILNCSPEENSELFYGGTVSLGTLGIITQYDMQLVPSYKLKERVYAESLKTVMENFDKLATKNRNFEFFPFLYADKVIVKELNETKEELSPKKDPFLNDDVLMSMGLTLAGESANRAKKVQRFMLDLITEETRVGNAHEIYPSDRNIVFNEMEYELPKENGMACLQEIFEVGRKKNLPIFFPMEVRTVKKDDFWMSPFYQRDAVSISIHRYNKYDYDKYFPIFEKIFRKYGGRPHWGKLCYLGSNEIRELYPKFEDFAKLKRELDPRSRFSNPYMKKLFGA